MQTFTPPPPAPSPPSHSFLTCYHACVAQKSYGFEKRFLCPPPIVSLSSSSLSSSSATSAAISVFHEKEPAGASQVLPFDDTGRASFKFLHVSGPPTCKSFHLRFSLTSSSSSSSTPAPTFSSKPISIVSKPSKRVSKSKGESAISSGSLVSLFNRINSQTVRTKFLGTDGGQLCAKNSSWVPFTINAVKGDRILPADPASPINYGQEVVLRDEETGYCSEVLVVKKVVKNTLAEQAVGPVTHLQRVALVLRERPSSFLGIPPTPTTGGEVAFLPGTHQPSPSGEALLDDLLFWTIVGIEKTQVSVP